MPQTARQLLLEQTKPTARDLLADPASQTLPTGFGGPPQLSRPTAKDLLAEREQVMPGANYELATAADIAPLPSPTTLTKPPEKFQPQFAPPELVSEWEKEGKIGFVEAIATPRNIPLVGSITDVVEAGAVALAVKRLQKAQEKNLSYYMGMKQDEELLGDYLIDREEKQYREYSTRGQIGAGLGELPDWMITFLLTGPGAKIAQKATQKAATRMLGKYATKSAGKLATEGAAWTGAGVARAAQMPHRVGEQYFSRQTVSRPFGVGPEGEIEIGLPTETPFTSMWKAAGDVIIESMSETAGAGITRGAKTVAKATGVAAASKKVAASKMGQALSNTFKKMHPGEKASELFTKVGYSNFLAELGEERLADIMRGAVNISEEGMLEAFWPGWEQLGIEATILAVPGATKAGVGLIGKGQKTGDPVATTKEDWNQLAQVAKGGIDKLTPTMRASLYNAARSGTIKRLRAEGGLDYRTAHVLLQGAAEIERQRIIDAMPPDVAKPVKPTIAPAVDPSMKKGAAKEESWRVPSEEMKKLAAQTTAQEVVEATAKVGISRWSGAKTLAQEMFTTPRNAIAKLGPQGEALVSGTRRADMISKGRAATVAVNLDEMYDMLENEEKVDILKVVNYLQAKEYGDYQRRINNEKAFDHLKEPISDNQRAFADWLRGELNQLVYEAEQLGGYRIMPGGKEIDIRLGGEPSPAMMTEEGQLLFAEILGAVDLKGRPNLAALRHNRMITSMIESGRAKNEGDAFKKLNRIAATMDDKAPRKSKVSTFDQAKDLLPAEFLEWSYTPVIKDAEYFQKAYRALELRRQWGWDYEIAYGLRNQLASKYGKDIAGSLDEWIGLWDPNPVQPPQGRVTKILNHSSWTILNRWATISKLGVTTSLRNYPERMKAVGEYGLLDFLQAEVQAHTPRWIGKRLGRPDYRRMVRAAGAVSKKPEFSGLAAGLAEDIGKGRTGQITQLALESRGFLPIERGNNINAALAARLQALRDVSKNLPDDTPAGFRQFMKSLWGDPVYSARQLLGETRTAAQRRFARAEFTKDEVKSITERGYLTAEELNRIMIHGAESKHFRADIFFNPSFWHKSAWYRTAMKFKIPWGWQQLNRHVRMCIEEAEHGNLRPLAGYVVTTTLAGELYQLVTDPLTGNEREDQAFWERAWGDFLTGGGIAFFENLVYGRTAWQMVANFVGGPTLQTVKGGLDTYQKAREDPEHIGQYAWEYAQKEITDLRRVDQLVHPKLAESRREGYKIRQWTEEYTETDQSKKYYMDGLYEALTENDEKRAFSIITVLLNEFEGMTPQRIRQSLESRSPLSGVSRREMVQLKEELPKRREQIVSRRTDEERELILLLAKILDENFK